MKYTIVDMAYLIVATWVTLNVVGAIAIQIWYYRLGI